MSLDPHGVGFYSHVSRGCASSKVRICGIPTWMSWRLQVCHDRPRPTSQRLPRLAPCWYSRSGSGFAMTIHISMHQRYLLLQQPPRNATVTYCLFATATPFRMLHFVGSAAPVEQCLCLCRLRVLLCDMPDQVLYSGEAEGAMLTRVRESGRLVAVCSSGLVDLLQFLGVLGVQVLYGDCVSYAIPRSAGGQTGSHG